MSSYANDEYRIVLRLSLLGRPVPMTRQVLIAGGEKIKDEEGKVGIFLDEPPEFKALREWENKNFSEFDRIFATAFRKYKDSFDFELITKKDSDFKKIWSEVNSLEDAHDSAVLHIDNKENTAQMLEWAMSSINLSSLEKSAVRKLWSVKGKPNLSDFSPYARFCMIASLTAFIGISKGLLGSRSSNMIDLEYLYYLPFCSIFSSNDKFQLQLAPLLIGDDQYIVSGDVLKDDLAKIITYFSGFTKEDHVAYRKHRGSHPPEIADSFTLSVWETLCSPVDPEAEERLQNTPHDEILKKIKPILEAIKKQEQNRGN